MERLEGHRAFFAQLITAAAGVAARDGALVAAFASTPRERFVGPGPWRVFTAVGYITTPSDDPAFLYQDVAVAISEERRINNGQPVLHAVCLAALAPKEGEQAVTSARARVTTPPSSPSSWAPAVRSPPMRSSRISRSGRRSTWPTSRRRPYTARRGPAERCRNPTSSTSAPAPPRRSTSGWTRCARAGGCSFRSRPGARGPSGAGRHAARDPGIRGSVRGPVRLSRGVHPVRRCPRCRDRGKAQRRVRPRRREERPVVAARRHAGHHELGGGGRMVALHGGRLSVGGAWSRQGRRIALEAGRAAGGSSDRCEGAAFSASAS